MPVFTGRPKSNMIIRCKKGELSGEAAIAPQLPVGKSTGVSPLLAALVGGAVKAVAKQRDQWIFAPQGVGIRLWSPQERAERAAKN